MFIGDFEITNNSKVFIIAELSANHNGSKEVAIETIRAAKRAGADCIKFQTYTADSMTLDSEKEDFRINGTIWHGQKLFDLYKEAYTPWEWHEELFKIALEEGLICFSSPFDIEAVDFLETLNVPAYKIASFEITDIPLIEYVASKDKPIIISTGIANFDDINRAIKACKKAGNEQLILLKCTSSYPSRIEDANLSVIPELSKEFNVLSGLSDHTLGSTTAIVATVLGARVIEKHFILDRSIGGPDASFSMDESEFSEMVKLIRDAENSLGKNSFKLTESQLKGRDFSRSIYISADIKKGEVISKENIKIVRPGFSLHPQYYDQILGKIINKDLKLGDRLKLDDIEF